MNIVKILLICLFIVIRKVVTDSNVCSVPEIDGGYISEKNSTWVFNWRIFRYDRDVTQVPVGKIVSSGTKLWLHCSKVSRRIQEITCSGDKWERIPKCEYNSCPIVDIQNGEFGRKTSTVNFQRINKTDVIKHKESLTLRCNKGYVPTLRRNATTDVNSFEDETTCENGIWSKKLLCVSKFVTCSELATSRPLEVTYTEGVLLGSFALFSCAFPNILDGNPYAVCLGNGSWSHPLPSCKETVICSEFPSSPRLRVVYSKGAAVGSKASFSCSPLSVLDGNPYSVCLNNGAWSHYLPLCKESETCSKFETSPGLEVSYTNNASVDSYVLFKCSPPKTLVGKSFALCQSNRTWSTPQPSCEDVLGCFLKRDPSSHLMLGPIKENYVFGDVIDLWCPPGQKLTSNVQKIMCVGKGWSDPIPDCI